MQFTYGMGTSMLSSGLKDEVCAGTDQFYSSSGQISFELLNSFRIQVFFQLNDFISYIVYS